MKLFFPFVALFSFIIYISTKKSISLEDQKAAFLQREISANSTRRKNIDNMDYITIPFEKLPFLSNPSENIAYYEKKMRSLEGKRILNLGGISNTDLKLTYGAANLPLLTQYDENYLTLVTTCDRWGYALINEGYDSEALILLELAVEMGCDSSGIYSNLNMLYQARGIDKTQYLIDKISSSNSSSKNIILNKLKS